MDGLGLRLVGKGQGLVGVAAEACPVQLDGAPSAYLAGEFIEHEDDARDLRVALDGVGAKLLGDFLYELATGRGGVMLLGHELERYDVDLRDLCRVRIGQLNLKV